MLKITKRPDGYNRVQLQFDPEKEPSLTKQSFAKECDVNYIIQKYEQTQLLTHVNNSQGSYGDFSKITDFQSALNTVLEAEAAFMDLPAHIRKEFQNDPAQFVDFINDEKNYSKAAALGLLSEEKLKIYQDKQNQSTVSSTKEPTTPQT